MLGFIRQIHSQVVSLGSLLFSTCLATLLVACDKRAQIQASMVKLQQTRIRAKGQTVPRGHSSSTAEKRWHEVLGLLLRAVGANSGKQSAEGGGTGEDTEGGMVMYFKGI